MAEQLLPLTADELATLEGLAKAATVEDAPWYRAVDLSEAHDTLSEADAVYIAAANPSALLRLLAQLREAEERWEALLAWLYNNLGREEYAEIKAAIRQIERASPPAREANTLTCVYCGMAYPEGTPPHGAQVLTDHIHVCEKHPMRQVEADKNKLRRALAKLVGADSVAECDELEVGMRAMLAEVPADDFAASIDAIHALRDTALPPPPATREERE